MSVSFFQMKGIVHLYADFVVLKFEKRDIVGFKQELQFRHGVCLRLSKRVQAAFNLIS